ncbi:hypothetical protein DT076_16685 [Desertihabitans brevis]|uniref:Uncharacterized protein n=1 Tax=Desertihabitans brevis TaxID=2268447 RepID=A0A367YQW9_9ACTN|nr:hypothetical protein DT076_16685 [Desertihabitans brevis]
MSDPTHQAPGVGAHALCGARTRSGAPCSNPPMLGQRRCRMHGGASPRARSRAERTLAEQQAALAATRLGVLVETSPEQALLDEVHRCAGMIAYYGQRAREVEAGTIDGDRPNRLDPDDPRETRRDLVWGITRQKTGGEDAGTTEEAAPNVWLKLWNEERDRLVRVAAACLKAGIEERRVRIAEETGSLVAQVIRRVLDRLELTEQQRTLVGTVVPDELRALASAEVGR